MSIEDFKGIEMLELANVDLDIRETYSPLIGGRFELGQPTNLQLVRLLRELNSNIGILIEVLKKETDTVAKQEVHIERENLYRTRWLISHNFVHRLVHEPINDIKKEWNEYLKDLQSAEYIASIPA